MPTVITASKPRPTITVVDMLLVLTARVRNAAPSRKERITIVVGTKRVKPWDDFMKAAPMLKANDPPRMVNIGLPNPARSTVPNTDDVDDVDVWAWLPGLRAVTNTTVGTD
jgi:hypothetical protein